MEELQCSTIDQQLNRSGRILQLSYKLTSQSAPTA